MATVHSLSVITNSCVKTPVHPNKKHPVTVNERSSVDISGTWHGKDVSYNDPEEEWAHRQQPVLSRSVNFDTTNMESLASDLSGLSDEEFYQKLMELKAEHKKNLEMCERVYSEKVAIERSVVPESDQAPASFGVNGVSSQKKSWTAQPVHEPSLTMNHSFEAIRKSSDSVKDFSSSKPPSGKLKQSAGVPTSSISKPATKSRTSQFQSTRRPSEDYWKVPSTASSDADISDEENRHRDGNIMKALEDSMNSSTSRIEDMWENFSVDEYAPRSRVRSSSMSRISNSSKEPKMTESMEWRHRITIPKPFKMTIRDENKPKSKTSAMLEVEKKDEEKLKQEESECQKKFKATPVPAHVYMPLYDEIMEEKETRRRYNRMSSQEKLKATQKPFNFTKREADRWNHQRINSASLVLEDNKQKKKFKANAFPEHLFDDTVNEKIREEEEYRKIRMQMRSEELMRSSSLPPNMAARGKDYTDGKSRQKLYAERARKAGFTSEHKFRPKVKGDVPDFEQLHKDFFQKLSSVKGQKEATVCKPFKLQTSSIPARKRHKIYDDIETDKSKMKSQKYNFSNTHSRSKSLTQSAGLSGSWASSLDSMPAKMTAAAELRASAARKSIERKVNEELKELEELRRRRLKEKQLKKHIAEKAAANDQTVTLQQNKDTKLREYKESERARKEEYRRQLNEIKERVEKRPFLFETIAQKNAEQAAERRYRQTVQRAGLDEDFIAKQGQGAHESDDDDDDYMPRSYSHSQHYSDPESDPGSYSHRSHTRSGSRPRSYADDEFEQDLSGHHTGDDQSDIVEDIDDV